MQEVTTTSGAELSVPLYKTENIPSVTSIDFSGAGSGLTTGDYPVTSSALAGTTSTVNISFEGPPAFTFPVASTSTWTLPPAPFSTLYPTITTAPTTTANMAPVLSSTFWPSTFSSPLSQIRFPPAVSTVSTPVTLSPSFHPTYYPLAAPQPAYSTFAPIPIATQHIVMAPTVETRVEYITSYAPPPPPPHQVQVIQALPEIRYIQSPPEIRYIQSPPEIKYIEAPAPPVPEPVKVQDPELVAKVAELEGAAAQHRAQVSELEEVAVRYQGRMRELEEALAAYQAKELRWAALEESYLAKIGALEGEIANLHVKLSAKAELRSKTSVSETYKVKSFELAAKLAVMDGTDDGLYNGLPIEVEGLGLYRDLVAKGYKAQFTQSENSSMGQGGKVTSMTTSKETYKVKTFEMAEKLSKMDGTDDGLYNGLPIEVVGEGIYLELKRAGRVAKHEVSAASTSSKETYKVSSFELAEKLSRMDGKDDGLYNGVPIEVTGQGLYTELVKARHSLGTL